MNPAHAKNLAVQVANAWPGPVDLELWADDLVTLDDANIAAAALVRLRRNERARPTIATFRDAYRAIERGLQAPTPPLEWEPPSDAERERVRAYVADLREQMKARHPAGKGRR